MTLFSGSMNNMFINFENYEIPLNYLTFTAYTVIYISYIAMIIYKQYNIHSKHQDKFWEVRVDIEEAYSRKSTEDILEMDDDDTGHWYFWSGKYTDPQFHAVNCLVCGEYIISKTINAPKCNCKNDIKKSHQVDDSSEYSSIDSLDIQTYNWISGASDDYVQKYEL